ncbi:hypothetical protein [Ruegeria atlantica]|uniref:hypothetical protein n=1 Tax=Ruegeria atlantica TaxID=81569 RepID=UPI001480F4FD|nr:hypothetical protein [Ruegeria atlantica]
MTKPIVKVVKGQSTTQTGVKEATIVGLMGALSAGSIAADIKPFDRKELFRALHLRLYEAKRAQSRAKWFGGRLYNRLTGQDPDYVLFSGTHLGQTLDLVRIETPDIVVPRGKYLLRFDHVDQAYEKLKHELAIEEV